MCISAQPSSVNNSTHLEAKSLPQLAAVYASPGRKTNPCHEYAQCRAENEGEDQHAD